MSRVLIRCDAVSEGGQEGVMRSVKMVKKV